MDIRILKLGRRIEWVCNDDVLQTLYGKSPIGYTDLTGEPAFPLRYSGRDLMGDIMEGL